MDSLDRISSKDYVPTYQDILRARLATTGINSFDFNFNKIPFKIIDVGGQQPERRKWIKEFDNITSVLYIISSSEYDQVLMEDENIVSFCFS